MSNQKHTPGPWYQNIDGHRRVIHDETATRTLAVTDDCDEQDGANARLIAAAPELLEALRDLQIAILTHCEVKISDIAPAWKSANAAIAKATGGAK